MSLIDFIIILVVIVALYFAVKKIRKTKGCGCGCEGCQGTCEHIDNLETK